MTWHSNNYWQVNGHSPLTCAVASGDAQLLNKLLHEPANTLKKDPQSWTLDGGPGPAFRGQASKVPEAEGKHGQADATTSPTMGNPPTFANATAGEEDMHAGQRHMTAALAQPRDSTGIRHILDREGQYLSSPGMPEQAHGKQKAPDIAEYPAISQLCLPSTTEPEGVALQSSPEDEKPQQRQAIALNKEPGRSEMYPVTPPQRSYNPGRRRMQNTMSGGKPSQTLTQASTPAASEEPPLSDETPQPRTVAPPLRKKEYLSPKTPQAGIAKCMGPAASQSKSDEAYFRTPAAALHAIGQSGSSTSIPGNFRHTGSSSFPHSPAQMESCIHPGIVYDISPETPTSAAEQCASRLGCPFGRAAVPVPSKPLLMTAQCAPAWAPSAGSAPSPSSREAPGPQATTPSQGSKENPHPRPVKGKHFRKPDWRKDSPEKALSWLMYTKVLHRGRGGGTADYQTVSVPLPKETIKRKRPRFGRKAFLQIETRLDDDISIPAKARLGKQKRDRVLEVNGGQAPEPGHNLYKIYCMFCKACEGYD